MAAGSWFTALKRAVLYHWNVLFVGVTGGVAFLSGRPDVVLPLAGAAEIAYLAILSSNPRFQNLAAALEGGAGEKEISADRTAAAILATLLPADRARYQRLSDLCTRLRRLSVGEAGQEPLGIPDMQLQNIDRLLRIYLRLLAGKTNLERLLGTVNPTELERDLARARERLAALADEGEDPSRTAKRRETILDTIATIEKRQQNYRLVQENHDSIVLELERLHTKIAGIAEMGIDRQDAASVGREIDLVASSVESTERTMREIEDLAGVSSRATDAPPVLGKSAPRRGVRTWRVTPAQPFQGLDPEKIIATAEALQRRITERFPDSGLSRLALEVHATARRTAGTAQRLATPILWLRALVALCSALAVTAFVGTLFFLQGTPRLFSSVAEFFQGLDAFLNELVFIGLALLFLFTIENRIKRSRALKSLYLLRSLAHIVDMHQLTKDPERLAGADCESPSSPQRLLTPFELARYLDYCGEMLALLSKLAALHTQHFNDPVTLEAVNDVENLTKGLGRTIWQKIVILNRIHAAG